ncbi:MAG: hypothetical protein DYG98_27315 [Haliscomenobacteraceae bacterium CHB4]|nr:hypothetical protein [Haliscomenobacteraceae bacterium CHB4]
MYFFYPFQCLGNGKNDKRKRRENGKTVFNCPVKICSGQRLGNFNYSFKSTPFPDYGQGPTYNPVVWGDNRADFPSLPHSTTSEIEINDQVRFLPGLNG